MKNVKLCALDIGSNFTGFSYYENARLKESKVIDESREKDSVIRCENMSFSIIKELNKYKPDIVVIEECSTMRNAKTLRMLVSFAGVVFGWALCNYAEFVTYKPTEWRKLVANANEIIPRKRDDAKEWAKEKVKQTYGLSLTDNEAEAILIGAARCIHLNPGMQVKDTISA